MLHIIGYETLVIIAKCGSPLGIVPLLFIVCYAVIVSGCAGTLSTTRVARAARLAATDPVTWMPLAGAGIIAATQQDEPISRWARTENPLWGSRSAARRASDHYREGAISAAWIALAGEAVARRAPGTTAEQAGSALTGLALTRNLTGVFKSATKRQRPHNGPVLDSLPSAHSSDAFAHAAIARRMFADLPAPARVRRSLSITATGLAAITAWGRVEAGVHYPSDVLAGAAVGNFATIFIAELFAPEGDSPWSVQTEIRDDALMVNIRRSF